VETGIPPSNYPSRFGALNPEMWPQLILEK